MRSTALAILVILAACGSSNDEPVIDAAVDAPLTGGSVRFRMSYQSDVPDSIFVQSGTELGGQGWLSVRSPGGSDLAILDNCGLCNCDSCDPCPVCGAGQPEVTEILRGGHLDWTWDGHVFALATCASGSNACEDARMVPAGRYLAHFCWSFTSDGVGPNHHVGPLTCADEPFMLPDALHAEPVEHALCACG